MADLTEFWIDVGGTFTDCLMKSPEGRLSTYKVLSSGITKGRVTSFIAEDQLRDEARIGDGSHFWIGYALTLLDESGAASQSRRVVAFDASTGTFTLDGTHTTQPSILHAVSDETSERGGVSPLVLGRKPALEIQGGLRRPAPKPLTLCRVRNRYELASGEEAPILAIRTALGLRLDQAIPPVVVRLGTTRGTNALLTRKGARTGFVTTRGFRDVLLIANQDRPRLFDLAIQKPEPLFAAVAEIDERLDAAGQVLHSPDEAAVRERLLELKAAGCESLAICLLHAFANPLHEQIVERIAREVGFTEISTSSRLSPLIKIVSRGDTTVMDAYVNPILRDYVGKLRESLGGTARRAATAAPSPPSSGERAGVRGPNGDEPLHSEHASSSGLQPSTIHHQPHPESPPRPNPLPPKAGGEGTGEDTTSCPTAPQPSTLNLQPSLKLMTSAGGLVDADRFTGKDSVLSGPAGGVIGFSRVAQRAGFAKSIGFDMGGTSTDVSRFDGRYEREFETVKAGVRVVAPMLAIETVAAGGGSVCGFDGVKLFVGPQSAGANPGPACYGRGGPLTITDVNFFLGKIIAERFPFPLDLAAVEMRLAELCEQVANSPLGRSYSPHELAQGFIDIANTTMARAIRKISVSKGYDPAEYVLVTFGGAGAQHACALAMSLGMTTVLSHPYSGVLSAYGIGLADVRELREQGVLKPFSCELLAELESHFVGMANSARAAVLTEGIPADRIDAQIRSLDLRYRGIEASLNVTEPSDGDYARAYAERHQQLYGYTRPDRPMEVVAARIEVVGHRPDPDDASTSTPSGTALATGPTINRPPTGLAPVETGLGTTQCLSAVEGDVADETETERSDAARSNAVRVVQKPLNHRGKPGGVSELAASAVPLTAHSWTEAWFDNQPHRTAIFLREQLQPGHRIPGPAIVCEPTSTVVIDPGFEATILERGELVIARRAATVVPSPPPVFRETNTAGERARVRGPSGGNALQQEQASSSDPQPSTLDHQPSLESPPHPNPLPPKAGGEGTGNAAASAAGSCLSTFNPQPSADPIRIEIFNHLFASIAEQMGIALQQTSLSTNVKERLDFSCGIFSARGELVVNAPHIPVHLGAMSETVRRIIEDNPSLKPGDVFVTNDPYRGGSHLPDVTVVTPVHDEATGELMFFTASRAHHAEIGGIVPGSMPPFSKTLADEGVLIRNFLLVDGGASDECRVTSAREKWSAECRVASASSNGHVFSGTRHSTLDTRHSREAELRALFQSGPHPSRAVEDNLADVSAQVAANHTGAVELQQLVEKQSWPVVRAYMGHIQASAAAKMRLALAELCREPVESSRRAATAVPSPPASGERARVRGPNGEDAIHFQTTSAPQLSTIDYQPPAESPPHPNPLPPRARGEGTRDASLTRVFSRTDHLDDGSPICVTITITNDSDSGGHATVDFTGTGPVLVTNLNANRAIVTAAVLYVFRCLIKDDIPLNSGVLEPVTIVLPECLLNPPAHDDPSQCAAMVGGNVETSQRVVDVLLGALGVAAASQGTMNNLTFGDGTFGYYETICGGSGATPEADGADAVHTHMTNTRLTDPEVIERRYPVRIHDFSIRRGSGGAGQHRGGDGITRRLEFLRPLRVSILSERRGPYAPFGLHGGEPGQLGRNTLQRAGSTEVIDLGGKVSLDVQAGDVLTIETPGGGGFGSKSAEAGG